MDVLITPDGRVVLESFLSSIVMLEWLNEELRFGRHELLKRPEFNWGRFFSEELKEPCHGISSSRARYLAKESGVNDFLYVLDRAAMGDWRDEEMAEPEHEEMWPSGIQSVSGASSKLRFLELG